MTVVNKFNVNNKQVTLDADIIKNMSANDVSYNASTQYDKNTVGDKLSELDRQVKQVIYDVTINNNGATFASLSELLSSENLSTLIPTSVRHGGMTIRFIQRSEQSTDNKYIQYTLRNTNWTTNLSYWEKDNLQQEVQYNTYKIDGVIQIAKNDYVLNWSSGAVNYDGSINYSEDKFIATNYIKLFDHNSGDAKIIITLPKTNNELLCKYGLAFYSGKSLENFISHTRINYTSNNDIEIMEISIPSNAYFFRTTFWPDNTYGDFSLVVKWTEQGQSYEQRLSTLEKFSEERTKIDNLLPKAKKYINFELGGINLISGLDYDSNTNMRTSDYIPMTTFQNYNDFDKDAYQVFVDNEHAALDVVYYSSEKVYLGYTQNNIINNGHSISEVAYVRFTSKITSLDSLNTVYVNVNDIWYSSNKIDIARYSNQFIDIKKLPQTIQTSTITQLDSYQLNPPTIIGLSNPFIIRITNQSEFDVIKQSINNAINDGETKILVYFEANKLEYTNKALELTIDEYPYASGVDIEFRGTKNCILYPDSNTFSSNVLTPISDGKFVFEHPEDFDFQKSYFVGDTEISLLSSTRSFSAVAVATGNTNPDGIKEYRIALPEGDTTVYHQDLWIEIFHYYRGKFFPVSNIINGEVYFYDIYGVDVSIDISIQENTILNYRWCNSSEGDIYISNRKLYCSLKYSTINESKASQLFVIGEAFNSVLISGISVHFSSDNYIEPRNSYSKTETPLILITGFNPNNNLSRFVKIEKCIFFNIRNIIMRAEDTSNNIIYSNNTREYCYKTECSIGNNHGGYIYGNYSTNGNRFIDHYLVYTCASQEKGLIADNYIKDFYHGGIICSGGVNTTASKVIVERNLLEYSDLYADNAFHLGDCGAIYAYREAQLIIVRDNIICNYHGTCYSPSIYMDGYVSNCKIYRNLIINNSQKYENNNCCDISMDAKDDDSLTYTGKNRFCGLNVITGRIIMKNRSNDTDSILAMNIEIHADSINCIPDTINNVTTTEEPYHVYNATVFSNKISLPFRYYFAQKYSPWNFRREVMQRIYFNKN